MGIERMVRDAEVNAEADARVEKAIEEARLAKDSDDLNELKSKSEALSQASMKMGSVIYGQHKQEGGDDNATAEVDGEKKDDNTVDADYKEKKDENEEKKEEKK